MVGRQQCAAAAIGRARWSELERGAPVAIVGAKVGWATQRAEKLEPEGDVAAIGRASAGP
jgi:hypothetical protein